MDRKTVDQQLLIELLERGWLPVWFAVEEGGFLVDLCCHSRLQDGKVLFVICDLDMVAEDAQALIQEFTVWGLGAWQREFIKMYTKSLAEF